MCALHLALLVPDVMYVTDSSVECQADSTQCPESVCCVTFYNLKKRAPIFIVSFIMYLASSVMKVLVL